MSWVCPEPYRYKSAEEYIGDMRIALLQELDAARYTIINTGEIPLHPVKVEWAIGALLMLIYLVRRDVAEQKKEPEKPPLGPTGAEVERAIFGPKP